MMATAKNTLQQLHDHGQSPWLDYITRDILKNGRLQELIELGIMGLTSNPTIFQKAISGSDLYDDELRRLVHYLNLPNVMIKIPGTPEGIRAFQQAISEGINVNVTLVFSLENYRQVAQAYIAGLEERAAAGRPIDRIASVGPFFVSRVDTAVDNKL